MKSCALLVCACPRRRSLCIWSEFVGLGFAVISYTRLWKKSLVYEISFAVAIVASRNIVVDSTWGRSQALTRVGGWVSWVWVWLLLLMVLEQVTGGRYILREVRVCGERRKRRSV
jgi:hypothetical protein